VAVGVDRTRQLALSATLILDRHRSSEPRLDRSCSLASPPPPFRKPSRSGLDAHPTQLGSCQSGSDTARRIGQNGVVPPPPPPPEVLRWARETLRGINVLTGYGRGLQGGAKIDLDPDVVAVLYRVEDELVRFLNKYGPKDPAKWIPSE
jgi:hypothetical protein